jgi:hypothetical protein
VSFEVYLDQNLVLGGDAGAQVRIDALRAPANRTPIR